MQHHIAYHLSYEETLQRLMEYHRTVTEETCRTLQFPKLITNRYLAVRKNVEIALFASTLSEWEGRLVFEYGRNHMYQEYYPVIVDLVKQVTLPRKARDYGCAIQYHHLFAPSFHKLMIYSFSLTFLEKPIFKQFHAQQHALEQNLVAQFSAFFCQQNRCGPEQIDVAIVDNAFLAVQISGLLTPFLQQLSQSDAEAAAFVEKMFLLQAQAALAQIFADNFTAKSGEPFLHFDRAQNCLVMLVMLSEQEWITFLDTLHG